MADSLQRSTFVSVISRDDALLVFGPTGLVLRCEGDSAALASAILKACETRKTTDDLMAVLAMDFEGVNERSPVILDAVAQLQHCGALAASSQAVEPPAPPLLPLTGARVVLAVSGAVASSLAPGLIGALQQRGASVRVALTRSARRFVEPRALEALTHAPVLSDLWEATPGAPAPHIALAEWADAVVVAPATATTLSRIARGDCSDLVSALVTATRAPVLLAPSMNPAMLESPAVQRNLTQLSADGRFVIWPARGVEVADAPGQRRLVRGPMPSTDQLATLIQHWVRLQITLPAPPTAQYWNAAFRQPAEELPWFSTAVEPELLGALNSVPVGRLLEVGTGLGLVAATMATRGFRVMATDVSTEALTRAARLHPNCEVDWLEDDLVNTRVRSTFDCVVDRCVLHTLPAARQAEYTAAMLRWLKPGGTLALLVHRPEAPAALQTVRFTIEALERLLAPLKLVSSTAISMTDRAHTPAWLAVFVRP